MGSEWIDSFEAGPIFFIIDLAINLTITLLVYGAGPLLFAKFRKRQISKGKLKAFCFLYTLLAWFLVFCVLKVFAFGGKVSNAAPAVLWGSVFYSMARNNLIAKNLFCEQPAPKGNLPAEPKDEQCEATTEAAEDTVAEEITVEKRDNFSTIEPSPETEAPPITQAPQEEKRIYSPLDAPDKKSQHRNTVILSVVGIVLCVAIGASGWIAAYSANEQNVALRAELDTAQKKIDTLWKQKTTLRETIEKLEAEIEDLEYWKDVMGDAIDNTSPAAYTLRTSIGFIVEGSGYYHKYDCNLYQEADTYWAHNIEYCEYLGYPPCPRCW